MQALKTQEIKLLNWNVQKQLNPGWQSDLKRLSEDVDLALFQEMLINGSIQALISHRFFETVSHGFQNSKYKTGVATYANVMPFHHRSFSNLEPWLRTPKATNISLYPLDSLSQTLLVVNVHGINFSFGMRAYQEQMQAIETLIKEHFGPVILAGDFNTWHPFRLDLIKNLIRVLDLDEVIFHKDQRTRFLGLALDHIFTRGLDTLDSETRLVKSSDHNPMLATFKLQVKV